ncbi:MAG: hypothetical protein GEU82_17825, partial [Luteitalea sp.]|nr:hypothetical protein [Luteitalea sp.]
MTAAISSRVTVFVCCGTILAGAAAPAAAQRVTLAQLGSLTGPAELVRVQDGRAYVASGRTLTIWDVSSPV